MTDQRSNDGNGGEYALNSKRNRLLQRRVEFLKRNPDAGHMLFAGVRPPNYPRADH